MESVRRRRKAAVIASLVAGIGVLHFLVPAGPPPWTWVHVLVQKLYYVPVLMGAYCFGVRGGALAASAATGLFLGHFLYRDPTSAAIPRGKEFGRLLDLRREHFENGAFAHGPQAHEAHEPAVSGFGHFER